MIVVTGCHILVVDIDKLLMKLNNPYHYTLILNISYMIKKGVWAVSSNVFKSNAESHSVMTISSMPNTFLMRSASVGKLVGFPMITGIAYSSDS